MEHEKPKLRKPEITRPQKAEEQKPTVRSDEVKIALEILLSINEHQEVRETELIYAARQFQGVLKLMTKIYGGAL